MRVSDLIKLDPRPINLDSDALICFVAIRNELPRLSYFLEFYRKIGVRTFFFVDNDSTDGSTEFVIGQSDCHCFGCSGNYFLENTKPPAWTNALANTFGYGHWCLTVDADELFVYPHCETVTLNNLCRHLEHEGAEALYCPMIDMYGGGPIADVPYTPGQPFHRACPYFDSRPGRTWIDTNEFPPIRMMGGVRERAFWTLTGAKLSSPAISKVPLIYWRKGMHYISSMHRHSGARLSSVQGALLHFKFMGQFKKNNLTSLKSNVGVTEKGLSEREIIQSALEDNPQLTLLYECSIPLRSSSQLVALGWMKTTMDYEQKTSADKTSLVSLDALQTQEAEYEHEVRVRQGHFDVG